MSLWAQFPVRRDVFVAPGHVTNMLSINGACVDSHKLQKRQRQFPLALASTTSISYVSHQATHNWKFWAVSFSISWRGTCFLGRIDVIVIVVFFSLLLCFNCFGWSFGCSVASSCITVTYTSFLILGSVGPTKSLPTVCHTHLVHQRSRVTANTIGKTKNTQPMGDSLAAPSFQKCGFSPSWPQDIVAVCIPLRRAKCGTSTSFLAVLKGSPVAPSRPAWDACKDSLLTFNIVSIDHQLRRTKSRAFAPLANCSMLSLISMGTSYAAFAFFFGRNPANAFGKKPLAPVGARVFELLDVLLSANPEVASTFVWQWPLAKSDR